MIDGVGMVVAAFGERLSAAQVVQSFVGVIQSATAAPSPGGKPRVTVRVNGGDEIALTWIGSSVLTQIAAGNVVGKPIQIVSNAGQWAGVEILIPCGKA